MGGCTIAPLGCIIVSIWCSLVMLGCEVAPPVMGADEHPLNVSRYDNGLHSVGCRIEPLILSVYEHTDARVHRSCTCLNAIYRRREK